jgi:hypothetical protein
MDDMDELTALVKADLDKFRSAPQPTTNSERFALLQSHLKASLEKASAAPAVHTDAARLQVTDAAPDMDQIVREAKRIAKSLSAGSAASFPVTDDVSPCGIAVMQGVAMITVGCAVHPLAGIAGLGIGGYLLTQNCHEGSTFLEE